MTLAAKGFVIRSMSTTDWDGRNPVTPYHIYWKEFGPWTASPADRAIYPTVEAAQAVIANRKLAGAEIAPADDRGYPTYWDRFNAAEDVRVDALIAASRA